MATMAITTAMKVKGLDFELQEQSRPADIFGCKRGIYRDDIKVTDAFITSKKAKSGEMKRTMALIKDLVGAGRFGKQGLMGYEENQTTQEMSVYADEVKWGVPFETYGYNFNEKEPWGFVPKIEGQLSDWHSKMDGLRIRQALCEKYDQALVHASSSTGLTSSNLYPHPNIFVMAPDTTGLAYLPNATQPAYSATSATYAGLINDIITNTGGSVTGFGWDAAGAVLPKNLKFLDLIVEWATTNRMIQGLSGLGSSQMYLHTVPTNVVTEMYQLLATLNQHTDGEKARMGGLGRIYRNLILVEDVKNPRCAITGTTLTFSYWGITDSRTAPSATVANVGFLLGASAIYEFVVERLHWKREEQNYGQIVGLGAFRLNGYNRCDWDDVDGTNSNNRKNYSSGLVFYKSN